jgi:hypothetical protein
MDSSRAKYQNTKRLAFNVVDSGNTRTQRSTWTDLSNQELNAMHPHDSPESVRPSAAGDQTPDITIPALVGKIYDVAPVAERCRMLEHLMKPLGALALVGVCNGIFTKIWFRSGWHDMRIRPEDAETVQGIDVISLADYVQQASAETINQLASSLTTSPMMVYSAAAAVLVTVLVRRTQTRRTSSGESDDPPDSASLPT